MRMPNVGEQYVSTRNSDRTLGMTLTWRVTKVAKKAGSDYVELASVNVQLPSKMISVRALSDARLFSRLPS